MLMRTDPFRDFDRLAQQMFGGSARPASMPFDAYRSGDEFIVHFDLPGVDAEAIDITIEKNVLTVKAERKRSLPEGAEVVLAERPQGVFTRQLFLGDALDADRLLASYTNGVLTLRVPVADKAKPRRVTVISGETPTASIEAHAEEHLATHS